MASTYMKMNSRQAPTTSPKLYPVPNPGDVVIWEEDGDILLCLNHVTASENIIEYPNSDDSVPLQSLKSGKIYIPTIKDCQRNAAPAKPISIDADGTINFVKE